MRERMEASLALMSLGTREQEQAFHPKDFVGDIGSD